MLIGAISVLSGDLHTYFLMREQNSYYDVRVYGYIFFPQIISSFFLLADFSIAELLISCPCSKNVMLWLTFLYGST